jgi:hypothetical protein
MTMGSVPPEAAPCGVYCGACPSFGKSCKGCSSSDRDQRRRSKWGCRLRVCCIEERGLEFCHQCDEHPCGRYVRKLPGSHVGDPRFDYRREVYDNLIRIAEVGVAVWLEEQGTRWQCPECGGRVHFYHYTCSECGTSFHP